MNGVFVSVVLVVEGKGQEGLFYFIAGFGFLNDVHGMFKLFSRASGNLHF